MGRQVAWTTALAQAAIGGMAIALAGCGGGIATETQVAPSLRCVDDSVRCVTQRQAALRGMLADPKHRWVQDRPDVDAYATGVRLFAFKTRKRQLSCAELAIGRREADAGPGTLRSPAGRHLSPAQISRGAMLATEVSRELKREMHRRSCRA